MDDPLDRLAEFAREFCRVFPDEEDREWALDTLLGEQLGLLRIEPTRIIELDPFADLPLTTDREDDRREFG